MRTLALLVGLVIVLLGGPTMAQSQGSSGGNAGTDKPVSTDKTATTTPSKISDTTKKPKVWTNDDLGSLKGRVSVVGEKNQPESQSPYVKDSHREQPDPHAARVREYRDAIDQLRTQIERAEARIAQLKDFKAENQGPSGGINPNRAYSMVPPEEQRKQLEARKKELQAKIEDLENQARQEGLDPGELR